MWPGSFRSARRPWATGCAPTGKSTRKKSRRCRYPSAPGCGNWKGVTASSRWSTGVPEKSSGVLREGAPVSEKYQFIDVEYAGISAADADPAPRSRCMCKWLGVSKSGFYDWRSRPESATAPRRRELLKIKMKALFEAKRFDLRLPAHARRPWSAGGEQASPELVRQLMRELGLVTLPAGAVAADHHRPGSGRADPRPG